MDSIIWLCSSYHFSLLLSFFLSLSLSLSPSLPPSLIQERSSTDALAKSALAEVEKQLVDQFAEKQQRQTKLMKEKMASALAEFEEEKAARYRGEWNGLIRRNGVSYVRVVWRSLFCTALHINLFYLSIFRLSTDALGTR